jgi:hypothetical protein
MDLVTLVTSIPGVGPYLPYVIAFGTICSAIATLLPPPLAGGSPIYATIYRLVNWMALNIGHARNASAPAPTSTN